MVQIKLVMREQITRAVLLPGVDVAPRPPDWPEFLPRPPVVVRPIRVDVARFRHRLVVEAFSQPTLNPKAGATCLSDLDEGGERTARLPEVGEEVAGVQGVAEPVSHRVAVQPDIRSCHDDVRVTKPLVEDVRDHVSCAVAGDWSRVLGLLVAEPVAGRLPLVHLVPHLDDVESDDPVASGGKVDVSESLTLDALLRVEAEQLVVVDLLLKAVRDLVPVPHALHDVEPRLLLLVEYIPVGTGDPPHLVDVEEERQRRLLGLRPSRPRLGKGGSGVGAVQGGVVQHDDEEGDEGGLRLREDKKPAGKTDHLATCVERVPGTDPVVPRRRVRVREVRPKV